MKHLTLRFHLIKGLGEFWVGECLPHDVMTDLDVADSFPESPAGSGAEVIDHVDAQCRAFIEASPFLVLATTGPDGPDCSPRGDEPGFVHIHDERTLLIPDRRGHKRTDSLDNIARNAEIALLFMIPGVGETLRIKGRADISTDPDAAESFALGGKLPQCVLVVTVESAVFRCSRAIARSRLWKPAGPTTKISALSSRSRSPADTL